MKLRKESIPWAMSAGRGLLGPLVVIGERCNWSGLALAGLIVTALLSDIFDGVLARKWRCDTAAVRLLDSAADTVFYAGVAVALWSRIPGLWHAHGILLLAVLLAETVNHGASIAKFGKPASYHSYLAKSWGLVLATAVVSAFVIGHADLLISSALLLGVVCNAEGLAMTALLPAWHKDVKSLRAAWQIRVRRPSRQDHRKKAMVMAISEARRQASGIAVYRRLALPRPGSPHKLDCARIFELSTRRDNHS